MAADGLAGLYAVDAIHELPFTHSAAGVLRGREVVRELYRAAWVATPIRVRGLSNQRVHISTDPQVIIAEQDIELTNAITGGEFMTASVLVMTVHNGKLVHVRDYTDNLTIATALGRTPTVAR